LCGADQRPRPHPFFRHQSEWFKTVHILWMSWPCSFNPVMHSCVRSFRPNFADNRRGKRAGNLIVRELNDCWWDSDEQINSER
jgi:hypothetical protein